MSDLKGDEVASIKMDYPSEVREICRQDHQRLIERMAYERAQARGFVPGYDYCLGMKAVACSRYRGEALCL
jgi:hypothetical protein